MLYLPANLTFWQVSNFAAVSFIYALHSRGEILYRVHYRNAYNNEDTAKQSILIETVWMSKSAERIDRMNEIPTRLHTAKYYTCMGPYHFYYACTLSCMQTTLLQGVNKLTSKVYLACPE